MQTQRDTLTLPMTILVNLNIMVGAGVFINTIPLAHLSGSLSFMVYLAVGLLMLPLALTVARLLQIYPGGNFYTFAEPLGIASSFASTWIYFVAKLATSALTIRLSSILLQDLVPALATVPIFAVDSVLLAILLALNLRGLRTSMLVQYVLTIGKLTPILFVIGAGILFFNEPSATTPLVIDWHAIIYGVPVALFALMGFEAACAISNRVENPGRNAPRALIIAASIALTLICSYQFLYTWVMGSTTMMYHSFINTIPIFLQRVVPNSLRLRQALASLFHLGMLAATLSVSYGILFTNHWNLYTLAKHQLIPLCGHLTRLNRFGIPTLCILVEGLICVVYLTQLTQKFYFQQISGFGTVVAYTFSTLALMAYARAHNDRTLLLLALWALCSSTLLMAASIKSFFMYDTWPLTLVGFFIGAGYLFYHGCQSPLRQKYGE